MIVFRRLSSISILFAIVFVISTPCQSNQARFIDPDNSFRSQVNNLKIRSNGKFDIRMDENFYVPNFISGKLYSKGQPGIEAVKDFILEYDKVFKIVDPETELDLISHDIDDFGMHHIKMQRIHQNIPVYGSQLVAHFDSKGELYCINGRFHPSLLIDTTTMIDVFTAVDISIEDIFPRDELPSNSEGYYSYSTTVRDELVIYPADGRFYLAYKIDHPLSFDEDKPHEWRFFIDANNGEILNKYDNLKYDGPILSNAQDMWNNQRTLNTYLVNGFYYMIDGAKAMFEQVTPWNLYESRGVIITVDFRTESHTSPFYYLSTPDNKNWDKVAVSAHCNIGESYLFFKNTYNRDSFDGNGESIRTHIHYKKNYVNAFWTDTFQGFFFGDGDGNESTYLAGAQDIVTHEFAHGVTSYTSNLEYAFQPGALNEAFSDIMASVHDSDDWLIGEDVWTPNKQGDALRSMADPNLYDLPKYMSQYLYLNADQDNGGVHINCGIPSYAFYLAATNIGRNKAGMIFYRAFTLYLTKYSQFIDARQACVQAAGDLYGVNSNEVNAVMNGFQQVGIGSGAPPEQDCMGIDEVEPNDYIDVNPQAVSGANPLVICGEITLGGNDGNNYTGDYDWYEITAPASGIMSASMIWTNTQADMDLYLTDIGMNKLTGGAGASTGNPENLQFFIEKGFKYYLLAVSWQGKGKYKLTVNLPESQDWDCQGIQEMPEPNDEKMTFISGQGILTACGYLSSGGFDWNDEYMYTGDWDWYEYELKKPGVTSFILDWDGNADLDIVIGDGQGYLISGLLGVSMNKPEKITMNLFPGYYMIAITSYDDPANYSLTIKQPGFTSGEGCEGFWETEPNDTIFQAQEVSGSNPINICANFDDPGDGINYGNMDVYKLVPQNSGIATIRMFWEADWDFDILVIRLYPQQYEIIGFGESKSEEQSHVKMIKANVVQGGEYYIAAAPWTGAAEYSIRIDIVGNEQGFIQEKEPNNGLDTAQLIEGISPMEIRGNITSFQQTFELDLFKTRVIQGEGALMYAEVSWTGSGNLDVYVFEIAGNAVNILSGTYGATNYNPEEVFVELPPGKEYFIGLLCNNGPADYKIHLGFPVGY